jgi:hypothetical protein
MREQQPFDEKTLLALQIVVDGVSREFRDTVRGIDKHGHDKRITEISLSSDGERIWCYVDEFFHGVRVLDIIESRDEPERMVKLFRYAFGCALAEWKACYYRGRA